MTQRTINFKKGHIITADDYISLIADIPTKKYTPEDDDLDDREIVLKTTKIIIKVL